MFTRIRCSTSSMAAVRAIWSIAAFDILYAIERGTGMNACGELITTIEPPCLARSSVASRLATCKRRATS